ncbi:hypothetical protein RND71_023834 [Anisodus tanguticus]|uniref:AP-1 complex subunit gamma n=1 Tax=Anisodus tanguticus TaxID=243964 RepID=A0AAE1VE79_9SOLA|nr:hypothetical protein RND71_023834 [Anisodus tanguticus]
MNPFSSGTRLSLLEDISGFGGVSQLRAMDMIRAIRASKTAAEERAVVRKECAAIRAAISENDQDYRHRNLAKLMFIHMLGYPTHFGQMECLKLIASPGFPEKRIGYLGLMLLLDERQEVLMLVTNSIKQDLNHTNQYIVGLALCALGNIGSAEMARDLAPEVERLLKFRDPNIRKKAALCSIRIIKKVPDLAENFINPAAALLSEKHHGVLITGVQLCIDLCKISTEALEYFRKKCTDGLVKLMRDLANSPYALEYDISGITDPFLQIRLLRLLRALGQDDADASDAMNDILAQVATKTESNKNAGNAILYECVAAIMSVEDNGGLRVLAINILGRFLSNRDNNIRYVALNMLMKALAVDSQAVQRHQTTILECVKTSSNASPTYNCLWCSRFSPEKIWYIDQMLKVLFEAGNDVKDEVWHSLIVVITNASNLHGYAVRSLYRAIQAVGEQETLVRVAVWCIGEYGDMLVNNAGRLDIEEPLTVTESDAVDVVETSFKGHSFDLTTRAMCLIALLKLSSRFPSCSQPSLVERMPVLDEATHSGRKAGSVPAAVSTSQGVSVNLPNGVAKPSAAPLVDLLDLSSDDVPAPSSSGGDFLQDLLGVDLVPVSSQSGTNQAQKSGTDVLLDLLSIGMPPAISSPSTTQVSPSNVDTKSPVDLLDRLSSPSAPSVQVSTTAGSSPMLDLLNGFPSSPPIAVTEGNGPAYPSIVAFESSSLKLTFNFSKQHGDPQTTLIEASFTNKSQEVLTNFIFQAAVPKFLQLHLDPASGNMLPANSNGSITQKLKLTNSQHGKKSLVMRIRIAYKVNIKDILEQGQPANHVSRLTTLDKPCVTGSTKKVYAGDRLMSIFS